MTTSKLESDLTTVNTFDTASLLRCSIFDVYALVRNHTLTATRDERLSFRFRKEDVLAYRDEQERARDGGVTT